MTIAEPAPGAVPREARRDGWRLEDEADDRSVRQAVWTTLVAACALLSLLLAVVLVVR
jgi:hypothetical protein